MNSGSLKILHLEDNKLDVQLIGDLLKTEEIDAMVRWARNAAQFKAALEEPHDIILSDYTLPGFNGLAALEAAKTKAPGCPFIFVSGTLGEEAAIEALKQGATDYVLKDRPGRLGLAIRRALKEAQENAQRLRALEELRTSREQLRALAGRLQAAREEERIRISRELHDGLGEMLTGIDIELACLRQIVENEPNPPADQILSRISALSSLTSGTAQRVRKLCTELRPAVLDDLGLVSAIGWQAGEFQARTKIRCQIKEPPEFPIPRDHATALFRIFQEILTNVARHSQASSVNVRLERDGSNVVLEVKDNGKGIRTDQLNTSKSFGLLGMKERATLLDGKLEISGGPGKGTCVKVTLPLPAQGAGK